MYTQQGRKMRGKREWGRRAIAHSDEPTTKKQVLAAQEELISPCPPR
jgi:hypothetical protein